MEPTLSPTRAVQHGHVRHVRHVSIERAKRQASRSLRALALRAVRLAHLACSWLVYAGTLAAGCAEAPEYPPPPPLRSRAAPELAGSASEPAPLSGLIIVDAGVSSEAALDDPAPPMCGPDGRRTEPDAELDANPDCPRDKNLEGCPCDKPGAKASCWPGKRRHRNHGQCQDGQTICLNTEEFGPTWGPCEDYVLPEPDATEGPEACGCFSSGEWSLNNLVPCIYERAPHVYVTSSAEDGKQGYRCAADVGPTEDWTASTLKAECAGQFRLCYTIKAGDVEQPKPKDCVVKRLCVDTWYPKPGTTQKLPKLPAWQAPNDPCTQQFVESGGYGEMSVLGLSAQCDAVDDGHGKAYVFKRTRYCSTRCAEAPDRPECKACGTGVSGKF